MIRHEYDPAMELATSQASSPACSSIFSGLLKHLLRLAQLHFLLHVSLLRSGPPFSHSTTIVTLF